MMSVESYKSPSVKITDNEINNLIFSLIKFGFRKIKEELNSPPNNIIKEIMLNVSDNSAIDNIIDKTLSTIVHEYGICLSTTQKDGVNHHMKLIAKLFMAESFELRNDLGEDKDSDIFITKH